MTNYKPIGGGTLAIAYTATLTCIVGSSAMSSFYGYQSGQYFPWRPDLLAIGLASLAFAADLSKSALVSFSFKMFSSKRFFLGFILMLISALFISVSVYSAMRLIGKVQLAINSEAVALQGSYATLFDKRKSQQALIAKLQKAKIYRRSSQCADATLPTSVNFCRHYENAQTALEVIDSKIAKGKPTSGDSAATMISAVSGQESEAITSTALILFVLAIEFVATFMLAVIDLVRNPAKPVEKAPQLPAKGQKHTNDQILQRLVFSSPRQASNAQIARETGKEQMQIFRILNKFEKDGLIRRTGKREKQLIIAL